MVLYWPQALLFATARIRGCGRLFFPLFSSCLLCACAALPSVSHRDVNEMPPLEWQGDGPEPVILLVLRAADPAVLDVRYFVLDYELQNSKDDNENISKF